MISPVNETFREWSICRYVGCLRKSFSLRTGVTRQSVSIFFFSRGGSEAVPGASFPGVWHLSQLSGFTFWRLPFTLSLLNQETGILGNLRSETVKHFWPLCWHGTWTWAWHFASIEVTGPGMLFSNKHSFSVNIATVSLNKNLNPKYLHSTLYTAWNCTQKLLHFQKKTTNFEK